MSVRQGGDTRVRPSRPCGRNGRRWRALASGLAFAGAALLAGGGSRAQDGASALLRPSAERIPGPNGSRPLNGDLNSDPTRLMRADEASFAAASGAGESGFDSLNRKRQKPRKGAGASRAGLPVSPARPSASANRERVAAAVAGTAAGQPPRRRLKVDEDPFAAVGFYAGSLLFKPAIELSAAYDTNPARSPGGKGATYYVLAPELTMASNWSRHSLTADLRGSYTMYPSPPDNGVAQSPVSIDRPDFTGKLVGRVDVSRDTQIDLETRLRLGTDNPGSPNISANLARYPVFGTLGQSLGVTQRFNRLEVSVGGGLDRTAFEQSHLTDGTTASNIDRNYDQYALTARAAYEAKPGVKPFVEVNLDRRVHDVAADRAGYFRDSWGTTARVGSTFELSRLLTGEVSLGYGHRGYADTRLAPLNGLMTSASLVWTATPLTKFTLTAKSSLDETTVAGVSGTISRDYALQVDHSLRRWLTASAKLSYGTSHYEGMARDDQRYGLTTALVYNLSRTMQLKGEFRQEWLKSTAAGTDYTASVFLVGLRLQR